MWAKVEKAVWLELRDKQDIEILEYKECVIARINADKKEITVRAVPVARQAKHAATGSTNVRSSTRSWRISRTSRR